MPPMIEVTPQLRIDADEIEESFVRASGPGGQNVNKLSTAVQLRFDVMNSPSLPEDVKIRLARLAGSRLTRDGVLVLVAQTHRTQERNRQEAVQRLVNLIASATIRPKTRRATRPGKGAVERRLAAKGERSALKRTRTQRHEFD